MFQKINIIESKTVGKILYILLILCIFCPTSFALPYFDNKKNILENILNHSVWNTVNPPLKIESIRFTEYHPVLVSALASSYSISPYTQQIWQTFTLSPNSHSVICQKDIKIQVKFSQTNSPYTFIIIPGAFQSWKSSPYIHSTIDILNNKFHDPTIIKFIGFINPNFVASCKSIPWDQPAIVEDVYFRLKRFLYNLQTRPNYTGIIGYSLGGYNSLIMLGYDVEQSKLTNNSIFGLGGVIISPMLHIRSTLIALDDGYKHSNINHNYTLTSRDYGNLFDFFKYNLIWGNPKPSDIIAWYDNDSHNFIDRVFNTYTSEHLINILSSVNVKIDDLENEGLQLSWQDVFINKGFKDSLENQDKRSINNQQTNTEPSYLLTSLSELRNAQNTQALKYLFDKAMDIRPFLFEIIKHRPLFVYLANDDNVVWSHDNELSKSIIDILKQLSSSKDVVLFNPQYGGHIGIMLDPVFEDILFHFFDKDQESLTVSEFQ